MRLLYIANNYDVANTLLWQQYSSVAVVSLVAVRTGFTDNNYS